MTVSGLAAGLLSGSKIIGPATIVGSAVVGAVADVALLSGDNTITIPTGAVAVWIVPPATNTQALKVRTNLNSGDAGLPISATDPFGPWSLRALGAASIIINSAGTVIVELTFI